VIAGTHGIGVSTPIAAAVAEATVGLAIDWHMPKVGMFIPGAISITVAISIFIHLGLKGTVTTSEVGAIPKLHWSIAPIVTNFPIHFYHIKKLYIDPAPKRTESILLIIKTYFQGFSKAIGPFSSF